MKTKQIDSLESYFKTKNEHWNEYVFEMLAEVLEQGLFENPEQPLELFGIAIDYFLKNTDSPLKAVQLFADEVAKQKLNGNQKLYVYEKAEKYLRYTDFDEVDLTGIKDLLKRQLKRLKVELQPTKPVVKYIREHLKGIIQDEFVKLPETLQELEPMQRLNIVCKLAPFVLPKVESVHSEKGEPEKNPFHTFEL